MASKPGSRWLDSEEDAVQDAFRKKEKEEKRRKKEEKLRREAEQVTGTIANTKDLEVHKSTESRPTKRRKTSHEVVSKTADDNDEDNTHVVQFPSRSFDACRDIDHYEFLNNIEEGSYGMVSRARSKEDGRIVALKRLKLDHNFDGFPVTGLREIQTLKACDHPHIVALREVVVADDLKDIYIVMDFHEHDLKTLLEEVAEPFLPSETKQLMLQLTSAISYLHANWILHRDLKTSNLLLNNRGELKLADFGMARYTASILPTKLTQLVVTLWYRSPELLLGTEDYDTSIDIWSLGCIFAELLTREPLFQGKNEVDQLSKIFQGVGVPTKESWPTFRSLPNAKALHPLLSRTNGTSTTKGVNAAKFPYLTSSGLSLLNSMLSLDPLSRPSAANISKHIYFKEDPRPKPKELFPTFPSKAGQEKRRRRGTPQAPRREDGDHAPKMGADDFAALGSRLFVDREDEQHGAGFALKMG